MDTMKGTTMQHVTDAVIEELRKMQPTAWVYEDMLGRKCVGFERPLHRRNTHEPLFSAATHAVVMGLVTRLEAAEKERDNYKSACNEWAKKTEWVQCGINDGSVPPRYLGWHRVDVIADLLSNAEKDIALKERIIDSIGAELNAAEQERDELRAELKTAHAQMMTSVVAEREACAKVCEKLTKPSHPVPGHPIDAWLLATLDCAKVIRARGK